MRTNKSEFDVELQLTGRMLKVYFYILKMGKPVGVSEIQKALGFKSPSHVSYYLDKLIDLGLIRKDTRGSYSLSKSIKVGVLKQFIRIGRLMLPRYLFYASFMSSMLIAYILRFGSSADLFAVIFGLIASVILWFETLRLWLERPF